MKENFLNSLCKDSHPPYIQKEHLLFRESLRKILEKEATPFFDQWEKDRMIPRSFWTKLGERGLLCPWLDEKYGGLMQTLPFPLC